MLHHPYGWKNPLQFYDANARLRAMAVVHWVHSKPHRIRGEAQDAAPAKAKVAEADDRRNIWTANYHWNSENASHHRHVP